MEAPLRPIAWQPLTPRGIAAFAEASLGRLFLVQLIVALVAAAAVVWFAQSAWFPVISAAIRQLPDRGQIRNARLDWAASSPAILAEDRFLALAVDLRHEGKVRSPSHIQVEFGKADIKVLSLFGYLQGHYPDGYIIAFNRPELQPWWGAWAPALLGLLTLAVVAGLLVSWAGLACLYSIPVWLAGFFANRQLTWVGSWRMAGAAVLPGAMVMSAGVVLYGLGALGMIGLLTVGGVHLVTGWLYLAASPFWLPRVPGAGSLKTNPFRNR